MRRAFSDGLAPCTCAWCGVTFARKSPKGKTPRYCSKVHSNRAWEHRHRDPAVIARRRACVCRHALVWHLDGPCRYCDCTVYEAAA